MEVVYERCAGLDVHGQTVTACRITPAPDATRGWERPVRTFSTVTADLEALGDWLADAGVTHVAMESTGVYWKPVYNVLAERFTVLVVNAQHFKAVPGRKTDVQDAQWLAELLQHGLVRGSFIPSREQRDWRDLTRHQSTLVRDRVRVVQRIHKLLHEANLKLGRVVKDITGATGQAILRALADGETDPAVLAALARGSLRAEAKQGELLRALRGHLRPHHRLLLGELLDQVAYLDKAIVRATTAIEAALAAHEEVVVRLDTLPGVDRRIACILLAELGPDLSRFPTAKHLASWAGLCPGNYESAGKRQAGTTRKGNRWLRAALLEAAHGAARSTKKAPALVAWHRRLVGRRGRKKAAVALAHKLLVLVYHLLTRGTVYHDQAQAIVRDEHRRLARQRRLLGELAALGLQVSVTPVPVPTPPPPV